MQLRHRRPQSWNCLGELRRSNRCWSSCRWARETAFTSSKLSVPKLSSRWRVRRGLLSTTWCQTGQQRSTKLPYIANARMEKIGPELGHCSTGCLRSPSCARVGPQLGHCSCTVATKQLRNKQPRQGQTRSQGSPRNLRSLRSLGRTDAHSSGCASW